MNNYNSESKRIKGILSIILISLITAIFVLSGMGLILSERTKQKNPQTEMGLLDFSTDKWDGETIDDTSFVANFAERGSDTYTIDSAESFIYFIEQVNQGVNFATKKVYLNSNIDLGGFEIDSIGNEENPFCVELFDGSYFTISNVKIKGNGLFGCTKNSTIQNLGLYNAAIETDDTLAGALIGKAESTNISNCFTRLIKSSNKNTAGLVGEFTVGEQGNSIEKSFSDSENKYIKGLIGKIDGVNKLDITDSYYTNSNRAILDTNSENKATQNNVVKAEKGKSLTSFKTSLTYNTELDWCKYYSHKDAADFDFNFPVQTGFVKTANVGSYYESVLKLGENNVSNETSLSSAFTTINKQNILPEVVAISLLQEKVFVEETAVLDKAANVEIHSNQDVEIIRSENNTTSMFVSNGNSTLVIGNPTNAQATTSSVKSSGIITIDGNKQLIEKTQAKGTKIESDALIVSSGKQLIVGENVVLKNNINNKSGYGGAVLVYNNEIDPQINATIENCFAENGGGAICVIGDNVTITTGNISNCSTNGSGGGIYHSSELPASAKSQIASISDITGVASTHARETGSTITLDSSTKKLEYAGLSASSSGGAVYSTGTVTTKGSNPIIFSNNTAKTNGGAIYATTSVTLNKTTTFTSNSSSDGNGGAIYTETCVINGTATFTSNTTKLAGGAIYAISVTLGGDSIIFTRNTATSGDGGAIEAYQGTITINTTKALFAFNTSGAYGGAVSSTTHTLNRNATTQFFNNYSSLEGGAVSTGSAYLYGNSIYITNSCASGYYGDAIYAEEGFASTGIAYFYNNGTSSNQSDYSIYLMASSESNPNQNLYTDGLIQEISEAEAKVYINAISDSALKKDILKSLTNYGSVTATIVLSKSAYLNIGDRTLYSIITIDKLGATSNYADVITSKLYRSTNPNNMNCFVCVNLSSSNFLDYKYNSSDNVYYGVIANSYKFKLNLDYNGGIGPYDRIYLDSYESKALPVPVKEGYKFSHWENKAPEQSSITTIDYPVYINNNLEFNNKPYFVIPRKYNCTASSCWSVSMWAYHDTWKATNKTLKLISCTNDGGWSIQIVNHSSATYQSGDLVFSHWLEGDGYFTQTVLATAQTLESWGASSHFISIDYLPGSNYVMLYIWIDDQCTSIRWTKAIKVDNVDFNQDLYIGMEAPYHTNGLIPTIEDTFDGIIHSIAIQNNNTKHDKNAYLIGKETKEVVFTAPYVKTDYKEQSLKAIYIPEIAITLDANGGECSVDSIVSYQGEEYGFLPTPTKEGYYFDGWYYNNEKIISKSIVSTDSAHTITAQWVEEAQQDQEIDGYTLSKDWFKRLYNVTNDYAMIGRVSFEKANSISELWSNYRAGKIHVGETEEDLIYASYGPEILAGERLYDIIIWSNKTIYAPKDSSYLFAKTFNIGFENLQSIQFNNFNTSNVENMGYMFAHCSSLASLDVTNFDTSNVEKMQDMFDGCSSLTSLDVTNFDTSNVTTMRYMFDGCSSLASLDVTNFDTSNVENMEFMFWGCYGLQQLDLSSFNMSKITYDEDSDWHTAMEMLANCPNLHSIVAPHSISSSEVIIDLPNSFYIQGGSETTTYKKITNTNGTMSIKNANGTISSITLVTSLQNNYTLSENWLWKIGGMDIHPNIVATISFSYSYSTEGVNVTESGSGIYAKATLNGSYYDISIYSSGNIYAPENSDELFGCGVKYQDDWFYNLKSIQFNNFNTSQARDMRSMFYSCESLESLDLSGWDTSNVTDMNSMFFECKSLKSLDLSGWDTSNVTDMTYMFRDCVSLHTVYTPTWDTGNVTSFGGMFQGCTALEHVNVNNFNTQKAEYINFMFHNCKALKKLDLSNWSTPKITTMSHFVTNSGLQEITFGKKFNTIQVEDMTNIFHGLNRLKTIDISMFDLKNVTSMGGFFYGCSSLETIVSPHTTGSNSISIDLPGAFTMSGSSTKYTQMTNANKTMSTIDGSNIKKRTLTKSQYTLAADFANKMSLSIGSVATVAIYAGTEVTAYNVSQNGTDPIYAKTTQEDSGLKLHIMSPGGIYAPADSSYLFGYYTNLTELTFDNFNTSNVTNMSFMFYYCSSLTSLDLSNFNTSNVTDMNNMFSYCSSLTSLDLSNFNTSNVTDMNGMFNYCSSLTSLDVSNFNTSNVTDMNRMFNYCSSLTSLDVSNFNTSNVTNIRYMFSDCSSLTSLDVSNFDTSKVKYMSGMFSVCSSLTSLDVSNFNTSNVTNMNSMFYGCSSLRELDISGFDMCCVIDPHWGAEFDPDKYMLYGCNALQVIIAPYTTGSNTISIDDLPKSYYLVGDSTNTQYTTITNERMSTLNADGTITKAIYTTYKGTMSKDWFNLLGGKVADKSKVRSISIDFSMGVTGGYDGKINISQNRIDDVFASFREVVDNSTTYYNIKIWSPGVIFAPNSLTGVFSQFSNVTEIKFSNFNTALTTQMGWSFNDNTSLTSLDLSMFDTSSVTTMAGMFMNCKSLTSVNLSSFDTSNVSRMENMFDGCLTLTAVDVSHFNTCNVTQMENMFWNCRKLTEINISNWNTSNVTDMHAMFYNCWALTELDVSNFNTAKVTNMHSMFYNCSLLTSLDVSNFNTEKVANMHSMFAGCIKLTTLSVSNWNTSKVEDMHFLFECCELLSSLDLSTWNTSSVKDMSWMFELSGVKTVTFGPNFTTENVQNFRGMFSECYSLIEIDVSKFNTANATDMSCMFADCEKLIKLDLSNFDMAKVTDVEDFFTQYCSSLAEIDAPHTSGSNYITIDLPAKFYIKDHPSKRSYTKITNNIVANRYEEATMSTVNDDGTINKLTLVKNENSETHILRKIWFNRLENVTEDQSDIKSISFTTASSTPSGYSGRLHVGETDLDLIYLSYKTASTGGYDLIFWSQYDIYAPIDSHDLFAGYQALTSIDFGDAFSTEIVEDMIFMFLDCYALESITFSENFDTSNVTNMAYMFFGCSSLESLNLSHFKTNNVNDMFAMFKNCSSLTSLDLSNWDTSSVMSMGYMFEGCSSLESLNLSHFKTNNVNDMYRMFVNCSSLESLDLSQWNTVQVEEMQEMFYGCQNLTRLNLDNWDTSSVTSMRCMFAGCESLVNLDLSHFNTSKVTVMDEMFRGCSSLENVAFGESFDTSNVFCMYYMFYNCSSLKSLDLSYFNLSSLHEEQEIDEDIYMSGWEYMLTGCSSLKLIKTPYATQIMTIELPSDDFYLLENGSILVEDQTYDAMSNDKTYYDPYSMARVSGSGLALSKRYAITYIDPIQNEEEEDRIIYADNLPKYHYYGYTTELGDSEKIGYTFDGWFTDRDCTPDKKVESLSATGYEADITLYSKWLKNDYVLSLNWFGEFNTATSINKNEISTIEFIRSTNIPSGYSGKIAVGETELDLIYLSYKESETDGMYDVIIWSNQIIYAPSYSYLLFANLNKVTNITFGNFNTSNVTVMRTMFNHCSSLTSLDLSNFNTEKVTQMNYMFAGCSSLTSLTVSSFDTSSVEDMGAMFEGCTSLVTLDLSSFDTSNVDDMYAMFSGCASLVTLDLSSFDMSNVLDTEDMLSDCLALKKINTPYSRATITTVLLPSNDFYLFKDGAIQSQNSYRYISNSTSVCDPVSMAKVRGSRLELIKGFSIIYKDKGNTTYSGSNLSSLPQYHYYGYATPLVDGERDGYTFGGWYDNANCTGEAISTLSATAYEADITLYAKWTADEYTITYNSNGGSAVSPQKYTITTNITLAAAATKTGYTFGGWKLETATGNWAAKTYTASQNVGTGKYGNITLVAQWSAEEYTITYNSNGGSAVSPQKYTITTNITLAAAPTKDGYTFAGWKLETATGNWAAKTYTASQNVGTGKYGNITLVAQWAAAVYNINYKDQGGLAFSGTHAAGYPTTHTYGTATTLKGASKTGYTFDGWFDNADCTGSAKTILGATAYTADITLYAKWTANKYKVVLDNQGATTAGTASYWYIYQQNKYYSNAECTTEISSITVPTKTGYTFGGYYAETNGSGTQYVGSTGSFIGSIYNTAPASGETTLHAKWTAGDYTITYKDGDSTISTQGYKITEAVTLAAAPTKDGYTFSKWKVLEATGNWTANTEYTAGHTIDAGMYGNVTLVAQWTANEYTITYNSNGGSAVSPQKYTIETSITLAAAPTKDGYTFSKWKVLEATGNWTANTEYTAGHTIDAGMYGNVTLVAQWTANEYTITYNSNGGSAVSPQKYTIETSITLAEAPTKTGYTFGGWKLETATGNWVAKTYTASQNIGTGKYGNITLVAQWSANEYTITYNSNGGSAVSSQKYTIETLITLAEAPTKTGYTFGGWKLETATGNWAAKTYTASQNIGTGKYGNITLVAQWEIGEYTLSASWFNTDVSTLITDKSKVATIQFINTSTTTKDSSWLEAIHVGETANDLIYLSMRTSSVDATLYDILIWSDGTILAPVNSSYLFSEENSSGKDFLSLTSILFDNFNTKNVENMFNMFSNCSKLISISFGNQWNTSEVTNMSALFQNCPVLTDIDLSNFNTAKVKDMRSMFYNCNSLTSVDVSKFNTSNVTDMTQMFYKCNSLNSLDVSKFNTAKAKSMNAMFAYCQSLTSLNVSNFNTSNATNMAHMFSTCKSLISLDVSNFDMSNVEHIGNMFSGCSELTEIIFGDTFNLVKATYIDTVFASCSSLTTLDLSVWNTSAATSMQGVFSGCSKLTEIIFGENWNTSNVTIMSEMFKNCSALTSLDLSKFNTGKVKNISSMFQGCTSLESIDLSVLNTAQATTMDMMFQDCSKLTDVIFGGSWNTGSATSMLAMFRNCTALVNLDVSSFNTTNVTTMSNMFKNCIALESITFSESWNTSKVSDMSEMFYGCSSLKSLDLTYIDVGKLGQLSGWYTDMFKNCSNLETIVSPYSSGGMLAIPLPYSNYTLYKNGSKVVNKTYSALLNNHTTVTHSIAKSSTKGTLVLSRSYSITYDSNGGASVATKSYTMLDNLTLAAKPTYAGHEFKGWKLETAIGNWEAKTYAEKENVGTGKYGDITLVAQWAAAVYNINYKDQGGLDFSGTHEAGYPTTHTYGTATTLKGASKTGYTFHGWFKNANCTGSAITTLGATDYTAEINLYAKWTKNDYVLSKGWFDYLSDVITDKSTISTIKFIESSNIPTDYSGKIAVGETELDLIYLSYKEIDGMYDVVIWSSQTIYTPIASNNLFEELTMLASINFDNFRTNKTDNMSGMFYNCSSLTSLDVSNFNTLRVVDMMGMFYGCSSLTSLDLSNFNTINVKHMDVMFALCSSLTNLDLSNFNTDRLTYVMGMFIDCSSLTSLDLSSFNMKGVYYNMEMLTGCTSLETIIAPYSTNNSNVVSIDLPAEYYIVGDASEFYTTMTNSNKTFSKMDAGTLTKTILKKAGKNLAININVENIDEDLIITLTNENVNNVNKMIDICTDTVVLKTGRWIITSDFDLTLAELISIFNQTTTTLKVEVVEDSDGFVLIISELI